MGEIWLPQWERAVLGGPAGDPYRHEENIKLLWHTWEGTNWGAAEGAFRPYPPHCAARIGDKVRQYVPLDEHAYALLGSRNENEFVIQVEVAGFAHESVNLTSDELDWLADNVLEPILYFHDIPDVHPPFYDDTDGIALASSRSPIRFNFDDWANYSGHVGHQHAPYPDEHWDPGKLNVDHIIRKARSNGHQIISQQVEDDVQRGHYCIKQGEIQVKIAGRNMIRPIPVGPGGYQQARADALDAGVTLDENPPGWAGTTKIKDARGEEKVVWVIGPGDAYQFGL